jgi:hypothetical protein
MFCKLERFIPSLPASPPLPSIPQHLLLQRLPVGSPGGGADASPGVRRLHALFLSGAKRRREGGRKGREGGREGGRTGGWRRGRCVALSLTWSFSSCLPPILFHLVLYQALHGGLHLLPRCLHPLPHARAGTAGGKRGRGSGREGGREGRRKTSYVHHESEVATMRLRHRPGIVRASPRTSSLFLPSLPSSLTAPLLGRAAAATRTRRRKSAAWSGRSRGGNTRSSL